MRKKNFFSTILSLLILIALIACGYIFFKDMDGPSIAIVPDTGRVSPHTPLQITLADPSNIRSISVGVRRNNVVTPIFQRHFEEYLPQRTVEVSLKNAGLREGAFELEIKATDASLAGFGQGNTRTEVLAMRLDTQPPRISVKTLPPSVRRGGAAAIRYTIDEEVTQSGVLVAGYFVPGFLQKDGSYICFFPFPYTMTAVEYKNAVELTATDMAGNVTRSRLGLLAYERNFKKRYHQHLGQLPGQRQQQAGLSGPQRRQSAGRIPLYQQPGPRGQRRDPACPAQGHRSGHALGRDVPAPAPLRGPCRFW